MKHDIHNFKTATVHVYLPVHTIIRVWKERLNLIGKCAPPDIHRPLWPNTFVRAKYISPTVQHKKDQCR